jgi:hypothetical protein
MVSIRFHRSHNGAVQSRIINLFCHTLPVNKRGNIVSGGGRIRTSTGLSPGLSENRNKSYALAQISASGNISKDSTATMLGLLGCRNAPRSNFSEEAVKEASISRICAVREISVTASAILLRGDETKKNQSWGYSGRERVYGATN